MNFFEYLLTAVSGISLNNKRTILPLYFYLDLVHVCTELHGGVMAFHEWSQRENKFCAPIGRNILIQHGLLIMVREVRHTVLFHDLLKS